MYDGIKKALRQVQSKRAPLKSSTGEIITDRGQQMERWVEHYSNLYSIKPWMSWIQSRCWNTSARPLTAWPQARPQAWTGPPWIKHCSTILLFPLYEVTCQCGQEGAVPQDAKIITLCKNKGERSNCNHYRGISLLSASLEKSLLGSYWSACRCWQNGSTQSHNVTSELKGQR